MWAVLHCEGCAVTVCRSPLLRLEHVFGNMLDFNFFIYCVQLTSQKSPGTSFELKWSSQCPSCAVRRRGWSVPSPWGIAGVYCSVTGYAMDVLFQNAVHFPDQCGLPSVGSKAVAQEVMQPFSVGHNIRLCSLAAWCKLDSFMRSQWNSELAVLLPLLCVKLLRSCNAEMV